MKKHFIFILLFSALIFNAQEVATKNFTLNRFVEGTIAEPLNKRKFPLVIIIPDQGPKDRNGNEEKTKNDCIKQLAEQLAENGIASFRYDKRVLSLIKFRKYSPEDIVFDDFVSDAKDIIKYFSSQEKYTSIHILGYGQGSLVGMLALNNKISSFISVGGVASSIDEIIQHQIENTAESLLTKSKKTFEVLKKGKTTKTYPEELQAIFDPSFQPFLISWMKYKPEEEIKKIKIPVLVLRGEKDLQVPENEFLLLSKANEKASSKQIKNMNHILKTIEGEGRYDTSGVSISNPKIPLSKELVNELTLFIHQN